MIDFQSLAIVRSSSYRPCHSPSPGGEGRDEGELCSRGRQSALMSCPFETFENSQQHARVIYGRVHRSQPTKVPKGRQNCLEFLTLHKSMQGRANLCKTPGRGEVWCVQFVWPTYTQLHLFAPGHAYLRTFPRKKIIGLCT
jgi:hypothetical protein